MRTNVLATAIVGSIVLAGLAVTVKNGGAAAQVLYAATSGWGNVIKASAYGL